jgi:hypothetical protein
VASGVFDLTVNHTDLTATILGLHNYVQYLVAVRLAFVYSRLLLHSTSTRGYLVEEEKLKNRGSSDIHIAPACQDLVHLNFV